MVDIKKFTIKKTLKGFNMRMLFIIVISITLLSNCNRVIMKNTIEENEDKLNSNESISKTNNYYDAKFDEVSRKLEKMDTKINDLRTAVEDFYEELKLALLKNKNESDTIDYNSVDKMIINFIKNEDNSDKIIIDSLNLKIQLKKN